jgi:hypothetical protein
LFTKVALAIAIEFCGIMLVDAVLQLLLHVSVAAVFWSAVKSPFHDQ